MWNFNISKLQMILHRLESLALSLACSSNEQCIPLDGICSPQLLNPLLSAACAVPAGQNGCGKRWIPYSKRWIPYSSLACAGGTGWAPGFVSPHAQFDLNIAS